MHIWLMTFSFTYGAITLQLRKNILFGLNTSPLESRWDFGISLYLLASGSEELTTIQNRSLARIAKQQERKRIQTKTMAFLGTISTLCLKFCRHECMMQASQTKSSCFKSIRISGRKIPEVTKSKNSLSWSRENYAMKFIQLLRCENYGSSYSYTSLALDTTRQSYSRKKKKESLWNIQTDWMRLSPV